MDVIARKWVMILILLLAVLIFGGLGFVSLIHFSYVLGVTFFGLGLYSAWLITYNTYDFKIKNDVIDISHSFFGGSKIQRVKIESIEIGSFWSKRESDSISKKTGTWIDDIVYPRFIFKYDKTKFEIYWMTHKRFNDLTNYIEHSNFSSYSNYIDNRGRERRNATIAVLKFFGLVGVIALLTIVEHLIIN